MIKKDITKILTEGSSKQRMALLAEDIAQYRLNKRGFLTDNEHQALTDSFKTEAEKKLYNKYNACDNKVINAIPYLLQLQLLYEKNMAHLTGYSMLWLSYKIGVTNYNHILSLIKDKAARDEVVKALTGPKNELFFATIIQNKAGDIDIAVKDRPPKNNRQPIGLADIIDEHKTAATIKLKEAKSIALALLEYMEEEGFNVKTYKKAITDILNELNKGLASIPVLHKIILSEQENPDESEETKKENRIFPDPNTPPDPDIVEWFKNEYLRD